MDKAEKTQTTDDLIRRKLKDLAKDGRIDCASARRIAEDLSVSYIEVGRAADDLDIRIRNCELGCFS